MTHKDTHGSACTCHSCANRAATCSDCGAVLTADNAFHPYGDCYASRCKQCDAAGWARVRARAAALPANPAYSNGWD